MTERQKMIFNGLREYGSSTARQLAAYLTRTHNTVFTGPGVVGALRPLIARGLVGSSNCGAGATYYWVNSDAEIN